MHPGTELRAIQCSDHHGRMANFLIKCHKATDKVSEHKVVFRN